MILQALTDYYQALVQQGAISPFGGSKGFLCPVPEGGWDAGTGGPDTNPAGQRRQAGDSPQAHAPPCAGEALQRSNSEFPLGQFQLFPGG